MDFSLQKVARLVAGLAFVVFSASGHAHQSPSSAATADLPNAPDAPFLVASYSDYDAAVQSSSQQSSSQSSNPQQAQPDTTKDTHTEADRELKQQESQRMLGVVPAFNSVISGHAAPLTSKQKFNLYLHSATDPFVFIVTGIDAGYEQATNAFPGYGSNAASFGKRYGAALADSLDGNLWGNAILPSVLHQDPRYFRLGHGTVVHRILYAAATTVICKGDNGKWQPSYSNIAGNFIGGAISNVYYPPADRGMSLTIERGATVTAEGALGSLALEFYPDVAGWWHNRHSKNALPKASVP